MFLRLIKSAQSITGSLPTKLRAGQQATFTVRLLQTCLYFRGDTVLIVPGPPNCRGFSYTHTNTHTRITFGRTTLDQWSARHTNLHLTAHNNHKRQTYVTSVRFEPATHGSCHHPNPHSTPNPKSNCIEQIKEIIYWVIEEKAPCCSSKCSLAKDILQLLDRVEYLALLLVICVVRSQCQSHYTGQHTKCIRNQNSYFLFNSTCWNQIWPSNSILGSSFTIHEVWLNA